jgi:hypothetical protein
MSIGKKAQQMHDLILEELPEGEETLAVEEQPEVVFYASEPSKDLVLDMHEDEAGDFETMEPAAHSHTME